MNPLVCLSERRKRWSDLYGNAFLKRFKTFKKTRDLIYEIAPKEIASLWWNNHFSWVRGKLSPAPKTLLVVCRVLNIQNPFQIFGQISSEEELRKFRYKNTYRRSFKKASARAKKRYWEDATYRRRLLNSRVKDWKLTNYLRSLRAISPEKRRALSSILSKLAFGRFRAKRKGVPSENMDAVVWLEKLKVFGGSCAYCGKKPEDENPLTLDHIFPLGHPCSEHSPVNTVPCCYSCNSSKGAKDVFVWCSNKGFGVHPLVVEQYNRLKEKHATRE